MGIFSEVGKILVDESAGNVDASKSTGVSHRRDPHDYKPEQRLSNISDDEITPPPLEGEVVSDGEDMLQVVVINRIVPSKSKSTTSSNTEDKAPEESSNNNFWNAPPKHFEMPPEIKNAKRIVKPNEDTPTAEPHLEELNNALNEEIPSNSVEGKEPKEPEIMEEKTPLPVEPAKKKRNTSSTQQNSFASIEGDVVFPNGAAVSANINGNVSSEGSLHFSGTITGNVTANDLTLQGTIEGSLKCKSLTLLPLSGSQMSCIKGSVSTEALYMKTE